MAWIWRGWCRGGRPWAGTPEPGTAHTDADVPSAKWGSSGTHRSTSDNMRRVARRSTAYHLPSQRYARQNPISRRPPTEESTQAKEHSAGPHEVSNSTMVSLSRPARLCQQQHGRSESEGVENTSRRTCHRRPRFTPDSTQECCCSFQSAPLPENAPRYAGQLPYQ